MSQHRLCLANTLLTRQDKVLCFAPFSEQGPDEIV
jgi:hypothetical protein